MRLVFMGTPEFSVAALEALIAAGHEIACVYSQPPRAGGRRGLKLTPSPVQAAAERHGLMVRTPINFKSPEDVTAFAALRADAAVVVAYGLLLPQALLDAPRLGCFNIHASLLPRWRGAAPIQRAIMAGDADTGVAIMKMDAGLDTGAVCAEARVPITPTTTAQTLHDELSALGAKLIVETLAKPIACAPQPEHGVTYAKKIDKAETRIDFTKTAIEVRNHIHGLSAWFEANGSRVKVLRCEVAAGDAPPGTVLDENLRIACGTGAIQPLVLQREGKGAMALAEFLRGFSVAPGTRLA